MNAIWIALQSLRVDVDVTTMLPYKNSGITESVLSRVLHDDCERICVEF